jgi:hypothetical protein
MTTLLNVSLSIKDWQHVINAVDSSTARKIARGEKAKADNHACILESLVVQCQAGMKAAAASASNKEGSK